MNDCARAIVILTTIATAALAQTPTYSNGTIVTHLNAGFGSAHASARQFPALVLNGFTAGTPAFPTVRLADDFTVPCGETWVFSTITTFGYQTQTAGSFSTVSTLTGGNYRIWDQKPNLSNSGLLHDYSAQNQMVTTTFSNIYRVPVITNLTSQERPVFTMVMNGQSIALPAGTYWLDYQITGNGIGTNGEVFTPPITTLGTYSTGNATQVIPNANNAWCDVITDQGFAQGLPFEIVYGVVLQPNCFSLDITQTGGFGTPVVLSDTGGTAGNTFLNLITLNQGTFPNGWAFGLDMTVFELGSWIASGAPFIVGTLDIAGSYTTGPIPVSLPAAFTFYYVGLELSGAQVVRVDAPKSVTIG